PSPSSFPYTTLFRSHAAGATGRVDATLGKGMQGCCHQRRRLEQRVGALAQGGQRRAPQLTAHRRGTGEQAPAAGGERRPRTSPRSEEHTSELQSREN